MGTSTVATGYSNQFWDCLTKEYTQKSSDILLITSGLCTICLEGIKHYASPAIHSFSLHFAAGSLLIALALKVSLLIHRYLFPTLAEEISIDTAPTASSSITFHDTVVHAHPPSTLPPPEPVAYGDTEEESILLQIEELQERFEEGEVSYSLLATAALHFAIELYRRDAYDHGGYPIRTTRLAPLTSQDIPPSPLPSPTFDGEATHCPSIDSNTTLMLEDGSSADYIAFKTLFYLPNSREEKVQFYKKLVSKLRAMPPQNTPHFFWSLSETDSTTLNNVMSGIVDTLEADVEEGAHSLPHFLINIPTASLSNFHQALSHTRTILLYIDLCKEEPSILGELTLIHPKICFPALISKLSPQACAETITLSYSSENCSAEKREVLDTEYFNLLSSLSTDTVSWPSTLLALSGGAQYFAPNPENSLLLPFLTMLKEISPADISASHSFRQTYSPLSILFDVILRELKIHRIDTLSAEEISLLKIVLFNDSFINIQQFRDKGIARLLSPSTPNGKLSTSQITFIKSLSRKEMEGYVAAFDLNYKAPLDRRLHIQTVPRYPIRELPHKQALYLYEISQKLAQNFPLLDLLDVVDPSEDEAHFSKLLDECLPGLLVDLLALNSERAKAIYLKQAERLDNLPIQILSKTFKGLPKKELKALSTRLSSPLSQVVMHCFLEDSTYVAPFTQLQYSDATQLVEIFHDNPSLTLPSFLEDTHNALVIAFFQHYANPNCAEPSSIKKHIASLNAEQFSLCFPYVPSSRDQVEIILLLEHDHEKLKIAIQAAHYKTFSHTQLYKLSTSTLFFIACSFENPKAFAIYFTFLADYANNNSSDLAVLNRIFLYLKEHKQRMLYKALPFINCPGILERLNAEEYEILHQEISAYVLFTKKLENLNDAIERDDIPAMLLLAKRFTKAERAYVLLEYTNSFTHFKELINEDCATLLLLWQDPVLRQLAIEQCALSTKEHLKLIGKIYAGDLPPDLETSFCIRYVNINHLDAITEGLDTFSASSRSMLKTFANIAYYESISRTSSQLYDTILAKIEDLSTKQANFRSSAPNAERQANDLVTQNIFILRMADLLAYNYAVIQASLPLLYRHFHPDSTEFPNIPVVNIDELRSRINAMNAAITEEIMQYSASYLSINATQRFGVEKSDLPFKPYTGLQDLLDYERLMLSQYPHTPFIQLQRAGLTTENFSDYRHIVFQGIIELDTRYLNLAVCDQTEEISALSTELYKTYYSYMALFDKALLSPDATNTQKLIDTITPMAELNLRAIRLIIKTYLSQTTLSSFWHSCDTMPAPKKLQQLELSNNPSNVLTRLPRTVREPQAAKDRALRTDNALITFYTRELPFTDNRATAFEDPYTSMEDYDSDFDEEY